MPSASESVAAFNAAAARALAAAVCTPLAATTAIADVDGAPSGAWGLIQSRARARFSRARQEDCVLADATPRRRRDSRTMPVPAARGVWEIEDLRRVEWRALRRQVRRRRAAEAATTRGVS